CYGALRVLHSFPTRRSSDLMEKNHDGLSSLVRDKDGKYLDTAKFVASVLEHAHTRESFLMLLSNFSEIFENPCGNSELCKKLVEDRKSTRLNSSHVKISYAV